MSLLRDSDRTFWTRTVWTTESAMKDFMLAGAHRQAMQKLLEWCDEASLVHWEQENDREPNWSEAHQKSYKRGCQVKNTSPCRNARNIFRHPAPCHIADVFSLAA